MSIAVKHVGQWEVKVDGHISCEDGAACLWPSVCWWPKNLTRPNVCAPPGLDMNRLESRISLSDDLAWFLGWGLFCAGVLTVLVLGFLLWLGLKYCRCGIRRRRSGRSTGNLGIPMASMPYSSANPPASAAPGFYAMFRQSFRRARGQPVTGSLSVVPGESIFYIILTILINFCSKKITFYLYRAYPR